MKYKNKIKFGLGERLRANETVISIRSNSSFIVRSLNLWDDKNYDPEMVIYWGFEMNFLDE